MVREKNIKKILFITFSNIGDVVATLPSLDYLKDRFPNARFTILSSPQTSFLFEGDPRIEENISYDKHRPFKEKVILFKRLAKERKDVIIDLRNTAFRFFAYARHKNAYIMKAPKHIKHIRLRHLYFTQSVFKDKRSPEQIKIKPLSIFIDDKSRHSLEHLLASYNLSLGSRYIIVAPGARSNLKRWDKEGFVEVCDALLKECPVVLIGDKREKQLLREINQKLGNRAIDLAGLLDLRQVAMVVREASLVLGQDSGISHLASYFNRPLMAFFGPTDEQKTGPWSDNSVVVRQNTLCSPCMKDQCDNNLQCMFKIKPTDVVDYALSLLNNIRPQYSNQYRRILVVRTDRLGDVLLSTPVIKNLRDNMPSAYIAMMVSSSNKELVGGNPYLDEVIPFDKRGVHKSWFNFIQFSNYLRNKNFDLALVLHPTKRVHLLLFFAGIKKRLGYDKKYGFLNNHILRHTKQFGARHEIDYALDFLRELGFSGFDQSLYMPLYESSERWADNFIKELQPGSNQHVIVIHPQASCPSKMWPIQYFTRLIDDIIDIYHPKIIQVGEKGGQAKLHADIVDLSGKTSISQLASLIKRSSLFISNDSGPVHIAVALGVPVISIFGRSQPGLNPRRWGHSGERSIILHKEVGCKVCLAHNCQLGFACLKAIKPAEVLGHVDNILFRYSLKR